MSHKTQKLTTTALIGAATILEYEILIYILNLDQPAIYLQVAFWFFAYLMLKIVFLFDLHFRKRGSWKRARAKHESVVSGFRRGLKILGSAFWDRFEHLLHRKYFSRWLHFLLIPGFIFWASVSLFYVNFGYIKIQQTVALLSSASLICYFWYLKEVFYRQKEAVDSDISFLHTAVKIYTVALLFAASLSMLRYYCLSPLYFGGEVFSYTFLVIYLALYQHRRVNPGNIAVTLIIALLMAAIGHYVYIYWGLNYFTAAIFMAAAYNLFWNMFHYKLDRALTRQALMEILLVSFLVGAMVISVTNFKARISDSCDYSTGQMR